MRKIDLELLGDEHRHRGVGALPHLDLRHDERDAVVGPDAHEGVGRESLHSATWRLGADRSRQIDAEQQTAAGGSAR